MNLIVLSDSFGAYMAVKNKFVKMKGFSKLDISGGAETYIRKYMGCDEKSADVTGAHTKISYTFDRMENNLVHDFLAQISDCSLSGDDAATEVVLVDFSKHTDNGFKAVLQKFAAVCLDTRPEDGFLDYTGQLVSTGGKTFGVVQSEDEFKTIEFVPERSGILCD
ncbi:MAG: hypothetical protein IJE46_06075 [Clostridia bacterium]|nr:hypothetical protein [Clostridia bacterium]